MMMMEILNNPKPDVGREPFLTFSLGGQRYALPIDQVVEVAAMVEVVRMPDSPPEFLGVVNRHGGVLPMLDLRVLFQQKVTPLTPQTLFIVAAYGSQQVGLVVDDVNQVEYFGPERQAGLKMAETFIQGVIPHRDYLVQIITLPALIARALPDTGQAIESKGRA
jgi:chemotaxis signal transduction protein